MIALTEATRERIRALFPPRDHAIVEQALLDRCGDNLPFVSASEGAERLRIAVLKISEGDLPKIRAKASSAALDWRRRRGLPDWTTFTM